VLAAGKASRHAVAFAGVRYLEALERAGGLGMVIGPRLLDGPGAAHRLVEHAHGLLLLGGPDVDPELYGCEPARETYGVHPDEDRFEMALLHAAVEADVPVLAVCRGAQVLNVAFGGTLEQHLPDIAGTLGHAPAAFPALQPGAIGPILPVELAAGSRVAEAVGGTVAHGAHSHHQAVDKLGDGLVVVGTAADGVVEAIEAEAGWIVGVQWHPEDTAAQDPGQQGLFDALVQRAGRRASAVN
jgi:gamma-glutamyl-gamma-aminobutyrate hydrolase PuuD